MYTGAITFLIFQQIKTKVTRLEKTCPTNAQNAFKLGYEAVINRNSTLFVTIKPYLDKDSKAGQLAMFTFKKYGPFRFGLF